MIANPTSKGRSALINHALQYSATGWAIIPTCGKKAACSWRSFQKERPGPETVLKLFDRPGITGMAVILGAVSGGLSCRDFDDANAYQSWAAEHRDLARTLPTVETARGAHVYFTGPEGFASFPDGEYRADSRHYVCLPPSRHPSGTTYRWTVPLSDGPLPVVEPCSSGLIPPGVTQPHPRPHATQQPNATQQPKQLIACVPQAAVYAIEASLPSGPGQRNSKIFELVRRLRGIADLDTTPAMLKAIVTVWHGQALPAIRTKDFATTWTDFQIAWQRVKVAFHGDTATAAYEAARRSRPAPFDDCADLGVLVALCRNLGCDGQFFLSCRTIEKLFGVGRMTASRWLTSLEFHGVIECIKKGTLKGRQATVWRLRAAR